MKKIIIIFSIILILPNLTYITAFAKDLTYIENQLDQLGIEEEYCNNILNYIDNIEITDEEMNDIIDESLAVFNNANEMRKDGLTMSELFTIYNDASRIANDLNINISIDFINSAVVLKNSANGDILFKCNKDEVETYYNNFKEMSLGEEDYYEMLSYVKENIVSDGDKAILENKVDEKNEPVDENKIEDSSDGSYKFDANGYKDNEDNLIGDDIGKDLNGVNEDNVTNIINRNLNTFRNSKSLKVATFLLIAFIVIIGIRIIGGIIGMFKE